MKYTRRCPKCGSIDIVKIVGGVSRVGGALYIGLFKRAKVNRHVCTNCGYVEEWMSQKDLKYLNSHAKNRKRKDD